MARFILIDTLHMNARAAERKELRDAQAELGLDLVDHGVLRRGLAYVVAEYGMFVPKEQQRYAKFEDTLIAGNSVLYAYDDRGELIDIDPELVHEVRFFLTADDVERAIAKRKIRRPEIVQNGKVVWQWPDPKPEGLFT